MSETKLRVSVVLPGGVMYRSSQAKALERKNGKGSGYDYSRIELRGKDGNPYHINVRSRKSRPAIQTINMSREAYYYMSGPESCPVGMKPAVWGRMTARQRLEAHLDLTRQQLGGISYTYQILDE